jgi:copper resistance protein C
MLITRQLLAELALFLALAPAALAHAVLLEVTPGVNTSIAGPDITIQLRFNARIDAARSRLSILLADHSVRPLALEQSSPATLGSRAIGLPAGAHTLRWQVLAADGHVTRGEVPFQVK